MYNHSGVLPPFLPEEGGPQNPSGMSPYKFSIVDLVENFSHSDRRKEILKGLLKYRASLKKAGIKKGFQWVAGSFVEDCKTLRNRPPNDVDIVTFADRPEGYKRREDWAEFVKTHTNIFDRKHVKAFTNCDSFYVDLVLPSQIIVNRTRYYFGLFTHQRDTFIWKGIIEVPLLDDDHIATELLDKS